MLRKSPSIWKSTSAFAIVVCIMVASPAPRPAFGLNPCDPVASAEQGKPPILIMLEARAFCGPTPKTMRTAPGKGIIVTRNLGVFSELVERFSDHPRYAGSILIQAAACPPGGGGPGGPGATRRSG